MSDGTENQDNMDLVLQKSLHSDVLDGCHKKSLEIGQTTSLPKILVRSLSNLFAKIISKWKSDQLGKELIHISQASFLWDIGKECRPRSDVTDCSVQLNF